MGKQQQRMRDAIARTRAYVPGRRVLYYCPICYQYVTTVTVDDGTVPETLGCRAGAPVETGRPYPASGAGTPCPGVSTKVGLPDPYPTDAAETPTWEWYRPDTTTVDRFQNAGGPIWEHIRDGGLLIRPKS